MCFKIYYLQSLYFHSTCFMYFKQPLLNHVEDTTPPVNSGSVSHTDIQTTWKVSAAVGATRIDGRTVDTFFSSQNLIDFHDWVCLLLSYLVAVTINDWKVDSLFLLARWFKCSSLMRERASRVWKGKRLTERHTNLVDILRTLTDSKSWRSLFLYTSQRMLSWCESHTVRVWVLPLLPTIEHWIFKQMEV